MMIRKLNADEIEAKVKTIGEKGAQLLLYKTARTDRQILDEAFGAMNWTSDYKEIKGNLYCGIGCRDNPENPFVWKWDCGVESREDGDGNEKKGEASDSFKRAGFQWGIGVELYTSPFIWVATPTKAVTDKDGKAITKNGKLIWQLADSHERFSVSEIDYDDNGRIAKLIINNSKGEIVFEMPKKQNTKKRSEFEKMVTAEKKAFNKAVKEGATEAPKKPPLNERIKICLAWLESINQEEFDKNSARRDSAHEVRDLCLASIDEDMKASGQKIKTMIEKFEPPLDDSIPF